ncbi:haloacid dehalogenase [Spirochaetia bacterium]|nr:haloacid dehalogenase [Spirochaetia bacterium]
MYSAAIFDLDGTLADSLHVWDHICRDWLSGKGITGADTLEQDIAPMTLTQSAVYVISRYGLALSPAQVISEWEALVLHHYNHTVSLKDGAEELLESLASRGMKLAIATSCFPTACEALLSRYGIRNYFSAILYSDQVGKDKTFPDIYLACAEGLGVEPEACIVFEDFYGALSGVRAAGMGMAAVYDARSAQYWEAFQREADFALVSLRTRTRIKCAD